MPLITDFRPTTLDNFYGNKETVQVLQSILKKKPEDRPHAYLFSGPRGCGKTTLAKILARELGCDLTFDFIEMNTASFRGIDTAREIIKNLARQPVKGKVRVWFLDECHRLTRDAQEALLKAVEEPPPHAYFIFSTTDPQELKPTLVDRCLHLKVQPLDERPCLRLLKSILKQMGKSVSQEILREIYEVSEGRPRTCLMNLERVLQVEDGDEEQMKKLLSRDSDSELTVINLCRTLLNKTSWKQITKILKSLEKEDPEQVRRAVLSYFTSVLMNEDNARAFQIILNFSEPYYNTGFSGLVASCYACYVMD